jgi:hypothetical protein
MGAAPRTVPVAVPVEHRLQFLLQQHRRRSLRHPVARISHAGQARALPMIFRYPPRPAPAPGHSSPSSSCPRSLNRLSLTCPANRPMPTASTPGAPLLARTFSPRLHDEALIDLKRLHLRLGPGPGLLPFRVGPGLTLVCTAPSLRPHYRTFPATTSRPAPVPRTGTLPLAARAARGPPARGQPGWLAFRSRPPLSGRQVLLFRASARDELTPPPHRAPPGQHAGRPPG